MMTSFELQSQSGQLWLEIVAHITAATDPLNAKIKELEAYSAKVAQAEAAILGAIQNAELDDTATVQAIAATITEAKKPDPSAVEKRRAELLTELAALPLEPEPE